MLQAVSEERCIAQSAEREKMEVKTFIWRRFNALAALAKLNETGVQDSERCLLATVYNSKGACDAHLNDMRSCDCGRKLFQSTKNSKRNVHFFKYLMVLLGPSFPITDTLIVGLRFILEPICENGIR